MREAVVVDAVRTPVGKRNGQLKGWHPVDLLAETLKSLVLRNNLDPARVDDVIAGCVGQVGEQAYNVARNAALGAGFPEEVPGTTIDRQCGSSQQAIHFAAQAIMAGVNDVVIACGVESMSRVPMGSNGEGPGKPFGPAMVKRYDNGLVHQGISAELVAAKWGITREQLDAYSLESHRRATHAVQEGRFDAQIVPLTVRNDEGLSSQFRQDEGVRFNASLEGLAKLKAAFKPDGVITAGNSSQISDGAAAVLIMERNLAESLGLKPRARFVAFSVVGVDPIYMLTGPIPATQKTLKKAGLTLEQMDVIEVNEAFASVVLAWQKEFKVDLSRVNINGGAVALGHPLGGSGARLFTTMLYELERSNGQYGFQTMCEGGGMANGTLIERLG